MARRPSAALDRSFPLLLHLRMVIQVSRFTQGALERRAGLASGSLSRILHGRSDLKLSHLLDLIRALELEPHAFFADLFGRRRYAVKALEAYEERSLSLEDSLRVELARLYGYGLESLEDLKRRLRRCEAALRRLRG